MYFLSFKQRKLFRVSLFQTYVTYKTRACPRRTDVRDLFTYVTGSEQHTSTLQADSPSASTNCVLHCEN
jgi:hypothetical protein